MIARPEDREVFAHFRGYVTEANGDDLLVSLHDALINLEHFAAEVALEREEYRYSEGKWSVKEVFQHLNDTERILAYRALRFARKDPTELSGFEENAYVATADTGRRGLADLVAEHRIIRQGTIALFSSFSPEMLLLTGMANGKEISVRALGWSIAGHAMHHLTIFQERYR